MVGRVTPCAPTFVRPTIRTSHSARGAHRTARPTSECCRRARTNCAEHMLAMPCWLRSNLLMSDSSGIPVCACLCRIICARLLRFRANAECKRRSRTGRSSSPDERCGLATRFFRSAVARPSGTGREDWLHPGESSSERIVRTSGGLGVDLSSE